MGLSLFLYSRARLHLGHDGRTNADGRHEDAGHDQVGGTGIGRSHAEQGDVLLGNAPKQTDDLQRVQFLDQRTGPDDLLQLLVLRGRQQFVQGVRDQRICGLLAAERLVYDFHESRPLLDRPIDGTAVRAFGVLLGLDEHLRVNGLLR